MPTHRALFKPPQGSWTDPIGCAEVLKDFKFEFQINQGGDNMKENFDIHKTLRWQT